MQPCAYGVHVEDLCAMARDFAKIYQLLELNEHNLSAIPRLNHFIFVSMSD